MNGNPNAAQKRFHDELREMYYEKYGGRGELHHVFGSKERFKLLKEAFVDKPGEWFVILLTPEDHRDIKLFSFDGEKGMFFKQKRDYEKFFEKPYPVPEKAMLYYQAMDYKQHRFRLWEDVKVP